MIINEKRAIAYFDILGFKTKIDHTPLDELASQYERVIKYTDGEFSVDGGEIHIKQVCHRYVFSDSIFLVAFEDTEESFIDLVSYAWNMMRRFITLGFPLRGTITYGDVYINLEKNIFLGKAISRAVELEGKQQWIGAIVEDSAIERYKGAFLNGDAESYLLELMLPIYDVPLKNQPRENHHVINWRLNIISEIGTKALFKNEPFDSFVQEKIDNTLCFAKEVVEAKLAYFCDNSLPQRYAPLYIGRKSPKDGAPDFTHGDEY